MLYVQTAQNNGSVYLHAYFAPTGLPLEPSDPFYDPKVVFHKTSSARLSTLATRDAACSRKYLQCVCSDTRTLNLRKCQCSLAPPLNSLLHARKLQVCAMRPKILI